MSGLTLLRMYRENHLNTRSKKVFYLDFPRTNLYKMSPIYQMCNLFNDYVSNIDVDTISFNDFKKLIDLRLVSG